jgi:hypothetical protein
MGLVVDTTIYWLYFKYRQLLCIYIEGERTGVMSNFTILLCTFTTAEMIGFRKTISYLCCESVEIASMDWLLSRTLSCTHVSVSVSSELGFISFVLYAFGTCKF